MPYIATDIKESAPEAQKKKKMKTYPMNIEKVMDKECKLATHPAARL